MKKLLLSILATFLVIGLVGAGTFAWFQDTETSSGNTFQAGTMDLEIRDFTGTEAGTWKNGVTATWTLSGMEPGVSETGIQQIELRNVGSIAADHLEIWCTYTVDDDPDVESDTDKNTSSHPSQFARYMQITDMLYTNDLWYFNLLTGEKYTRTATNQPWVLAATDNKWKVEDKAGVDEEGNVIPADGIITLFDLNQDPLDDLTPPNGDTQFEMMLKLHSSADNGIQGDTLNLTVIFTLNQDSSQ